MNDGDSSVLKKKTTLFVCNFYLPTPMANGVCVSAVAEQLVLEGENVHVLCFASKNEKKQELISGVNVHRIPQGIVNKLIRDHNSDSSKSSSKYKLKIALTLNKLKKLLLLPLFPLSSPGLVYSLRKEVRRIHMEYSVDTVVSVNNPIETSLSVYLSKNRKHDFNWIIYMLDSLSNGLKPKYMSEEIYKYFGMKWEKKLFRKANKILNLVGNKHHYSNDLYLEFKDKMDYVDLPLFKPNIDQVVNSRENNEIKKITFAGALMRDLRNPTFCLEVFKYIHSKLSFEFEFSLYSRGDCQDILDKYTDNKSIIHQDYVPHEEMIKIINSSDILISIGNRFTEMVPSKTFEYISSGHKIIHFYNNINDPSLMYFKLYENCILIYEHDDFNENVNKIVDFFQVNKLDLNTEVLSEIYSDNLATQTTKKIRN